MARRIGGSYLKGCLLQAVVLAVLLGSAVVGGVFGALVPLPPRADRGLFFVLMLFGAMLGSGFLFTAAIALWSTLRTRQLVASWRALGFAGGGVFQRIVVQGTRGGRELSVATERGPRLEIRAPVRVFTRLAVGTSSAPGRFVARLIGATPIEVASDPAYAGLVASGADAPWAWSVLTRPEFRALAPRLLAPATAAEIRALVLVPGQVVFSVHFAAPETLVPRDTELLDGVLELARLLENQPPPTQPLPPSPSDIRDMRRTVNAFSALAASFGIASLGLGALACVSGAVLVLMRVI